MSEKYFDALARDKSVGKVKLNPVYSEIGAAKGFDADDPMSVVEELTRSVTKAMDEFILKQFERHGYSEKEVMDLAIAGKIEAVEHGNITDYFVNGLLLFWIERFAYDLEDAEDGYYSLKTELYCTDSIPPVMGDVRGKKDEENT